VVCGVFGFYALQKHSNSVAQIAAESPSPLGGPVITPTPESHASPSPEKKVQEAPVAVPKKSPREETKKTPELTRQEPPDEGEGHVGDVRVNPPDIPEPPDVDRP